MLAVEGPASAALDALGRWRGGSAGLDAAVERYRGAARRARRAGVATEGLRFEASFGRTTLEYYDGFVFGALPRGRADLPPIASGGRYDALTRVLGRGRGIPAVGGIVRPEALLALGGGHGHEARRSVEGPVQEDTIAWFADRGVRRAKSGTGREYRGTVRGRRGGRAGAALGGESRASWRRAGCIWG